MDHDRRLIHVPNFEFKNLYAIIFPMKTFTTSLKVF